jgi:hypothetical protein
MGGSGGVFAVSFTAVLSKREKYANNKKTKHTGKKNAFAI